MQLSTKVVSVCEFTLQAMFPKSRFESFHFLELLYIYIL